MIRRLVLLSQVVLILGLCGHVWGAQSLYPYPCATPCMPNTAGFGYFPTRWRQWPGEQRLEQTNPKAFGSEVLPTPQGQEIVAPPPAAPPGQLPSPAPQGEILPPGGTILPPQEPPAEPKGEKPAKPSTEGSLPGLPGLPVEPGQGPLPALPNGPAKPTKPDSKPKEQPKPKDTTRPATVGAVTVDGAFGDVEGTNRVAPTFGPSDERQVQPGSVMSLIDPQAPERKPAASATHRADTIAITVPASPDHEIEPAAYATVDSAPTPTATNAKSARPMVALNGYCPVELVRNGRWKPGDLRWTVVHDGWIYRLSGPAQRQEFQANPEAFTAAYSGNDPVLTVDEHRAVPGQLAYCATYNGRLYVFTSAATQLRFNKDPQRYVTK